MIQGNRIVRYVCGSPRVVTYIVIHVHATKRALLQITNNEDNMLCVKFHLHAIYLILR